MNKIKKRTMFVTLAVTVAVGLGLTIDNTRVDVEDISVSLVGLPEAFDGLRIVHLSDLHLPHCVRTPKKLAALVKKQRPDIIALTGDLTDKFSHFDEEGLTTLVEELTAIAPCYAVAGNHEIIAGVLDEWTYILCAAGVTVLDNESIVIARDTATVTLCGLTYGNPFKKDNKDTDGVTIVLSHYPENMPAYVDAAFDLVLSGHAHGGQVRLFGQGLISPGEGLLPFYTSGLYEQEGTQMVVSRGLKSSIFPLRIFNAPHMPVIVLKSAPF